MSGNEKEGLDASDSDFDPSDEDDEAVDAETETEAEQPADDAEEATEAEPTDDESEADEAAGPQLDEDVMPDEQRKLTSSSPSRTTSVLVSTSGPSRRPTTWSGSSTASVTTGCTCSTSPDGRAHPHRRGLPVGLRPRADPGTHRRASTAGSRPRSSPTRSARASAPAGSSPAR